MENQQKSSREGRQITRQRPSRQKQAESGGPELKLVVKPPVKVEGEGEGDRVAKHTQSVGSWTGKRIVRIVESEGNTEIIGEAGC